MKPLSAGLHLLLAGLLLVVAFAVMEPSSAVGIGMGQRVLFFAAHVFPAMGVAWVCSGWLVNRRALQRCSPWLLLVIAGALAGVALAPLSVALESAFGVLDLDDPAPLAQTTGYAGWLREVGDELQQVPPKTALFWPLMNAWVMWRVGARDAEPAQPADGARHAQSLEASGLSESAEPPGPGESTEAVGQAPDGDRAGSGPGLLERLPARLGRDVRILQAQQHYLRVVTARGEHLLLHGFGPAAAELERHGIAGMQIHRSLWVAWKHVDRLDLRPGALAVVARSGERLPIGRRRAKAVATAWQQWPGT